MDGELFLMLMVLWITTTYALVTFFRCVNPYVGITLYFSRRPSCSADFLLLYSTLYRFWFQNTGEGFHPHSVDIDDRHGSFLVVSGGTACKCDCAVKSISSFVAPRGSSSSQNFCVTTVIMAIVGVLGSRRWFAVGDANEGEVWRQHLRHHGHSLRH